MYENKSKGKITAQTIAIFGVFTALGIICSMNFPLGLTIRLTEATKFSPSFIIVAIIARKYGVWGSTLIAFLIDAMQSLFAGFGVPNPVISLAATLTGLIFGLFFKKSVSLPRIIIAVLITQIICSMGITTYALIVYFGVPIQPTLITRAIQSAINIPLQIILIYLLLNKFDIPKRIKLT